MDSASLQPIQGMSDICAPEVYLWQHVERVADEVMRCYGLTEVRTPVVEYTQVFTRSLGETTDVVQKEMYTFEDRGGRQLPLRPEGTAGVIRFAAPRYGVDGGADRLYYKGPMFRCERPQAGRKRQFHQLGVEIMGPACAAADVETIALQVRLLQALGLNDCTVKLNTRGLPEDRPSMTEGLRRALEPDLPKLCAECTRRLDQNIMRILDCKNEACQEVAGRLPPVTSFMGEASRVYLDEVIRLLNLLQIPFVHDTRLVRGLDYYVHTVWEVSHPALGAQDAVAGGGRYRIEMGGKTVEGVGFAMGLERLVTILQAVGVKADERAAKPVAWLISLGAPALDQNMILACELRKQGVACGLVSAPGSIKSQMRAANRVGATYAVIRGDNELAQGKVVLKKMQDGSQVELGLGELIDVLKKG